MERTEACGGEPTASIGISSFVGMSAGRRFALGLFSGQRIDVVARFSLAGGDPEASDASRVRVAGAFESVADAHDIT